MSRDYFNCKKQDLRLEMFRYIQTHEVSLKAESLVTVSFPLLRSKPTISARSGGGGRENLTTSPVHGCLNLPRKTKVEKGSYLSCSSPKF